MQGVNLRCGSFTGVGCLRPASQMRPARTFNMVRSKIFDTHVRTQHRVKTKLPDKQARRQYVKKSLSRSLT